MAVFTFRTPVFVYSASSSETLYCAVQGHEFARHQGFSKRLRVYFIQETKQMLDLKVWLN